jgi:lipopolysaccharide/colanic/teichoic acid biosynthesis glycosyltransferase
MTRRIAITGASGSVGRIIVPRLAEAGLDIVLAGRDPERLRALFPDHVSVVYDKLAPSLRNCDAVLHLAVLNNDQNGSLEAFRAANVDFLLHVAKMARTAGVPLFINATTIRALDARATDPYTATKREGEGALRGIEGLGCVSLRLPAVYGARFTGRLSALNRLPTFVRRPALMTAAAFRPVVHADRVADAIIALLDEAEESEVIVSDPPEGNAVYRVGKRCIDVAFVAVVAILLWWLMAIAWIAVKLGSPGPGLFAQPRVGKNERVFTCYKFRTMRTGTPQAGTHEVPTTHITPVGRLLRRTKIDELPQIWNVARGEMSLVGPRPCLPNQVDLIGWRRKFGVFRCRPGITGLAQVQGVDMSEPERLARLDARYCALRSLFTDIRLAVVTLLP